MAVVVPFSCPKPSPLMAKSTASPLTIAAEERQVIVALAYRFSVEIAWGECDDGDEWAAVLPTGRGGDGGALAHCFPEPKGWVVTAGAEAEQWKLNTVHEAVAMVATLL